MPLQESRPKETATLQHSSPALVLGSEEPIWRSPQIFKPFPLYTASNEAPSGWLREDINIKNLITLYIFILLAAYWLPYWQKEESTARLNVGGWTKADWKISFGWLQPSSLDSARYVCSFHFKLLLHSHWLVYRHIHIQAPQISTAPLSQETVQQLCCFVVLFIRGIKFGWI